MVIIDLEDNLEEVIEMLRTCAISPGTFREGCYRLNPVSFASVVGKLHEVARLSITLAELAVDTIGDSDD